MFYAVNKWTKEHKAYSARSDLPADVLSGNCDIVLADAEGWIEWSGKKCPLPDGAKYKTKHKSGFVIEGNHPEALKDHWAGRLDPIVKYRPILDDDKPTSEGTFMTNYLVSKTTKEHFLARNSSPADANDEDLILVKGDADGWIEWWGDKECPLPGDQPCEVMNKSGDIFDFNCAKNINQYSWTQITAYRPILKPDDKPKAPLKDKPWWSVYQPEPPERDGKGLPPVGVRAEFSINDGKYWPAVVKYKSSKFCILQYDQGGKGERCYTRDHHIDARPIRTDREKWVEAALKHVSCPPAPLIRNDLTKRFGYLYDAFVNGDLSTPKPEQPDEDMNDPANWRAGDWLQAKEDDLDLTKNKLYQVTRMDNINFPVIDDDADKGAVRLASRFRFHSRPTNPTNKTGGDA